MLEKLQEYRRYISDQVTDQQLIAAFFYLWMLSAKDGVFTGETQKMIRRRRKKQRIDDADLQTMKGLFVEIGDNQQKAGYSENS